MGSLRFFLLFTILFCGINLLAQDSFYKQINTDNIRHAHTLTPTPDGGFVFGGWKMQVIDDSVHLIIGKVDFRGDTEWSISDKFRKETELEDIVVDSEGNIVVLIDRSKGAFGRSQILLKLNSDGEKIYEKIFWEYGSSRNFFYKKIIATKSGGYFMLFSNHSRKALIKINKEGSVQWIKDISIGLFGRSINVTEDGEGGFVIVGFDAAISSKTISSIVKISADGVVLLAMTIDNQGFYGVQMFSNGDILLSGMDRFGDHEVFVRMSPDGEIIWSKSMQGIQSLTNLCFFNGFYANTYCSYLSRIFITKEDKIIIVGRYDLNGERLMIVKMDGGANLEWGKVYPINATKHVNYVLSSDEGIGALMYDLGIEEAAAVILKTDKDGIIENCEYQEICPHFEDVHFEKGPLGVEVTDVEPDSRELETELVPILISTSDIVCGSLNINIPDATFFVSDTICWGDCVTVETMPQQVAENWEWYFEGGVPSYSSEENPGEICFPLPGTYQIEHIATFLGCKYPYTTEIIVHTAPFDLGNDTLLCEDVTLLLDATLPNALSYMWKNGSTESFREITAAGDYSVTVTDGNCNGIDSINVRYLSDWLGDNPFDIGTDTVVCPYLPITLDASVQGLSGYIWSNGKEGAEQKVSQPGLYGVDAFYEHCPLSDEIEIGYFDCRGKIYIPNAFSPNGDNVNDFFEIYGRDVELVEVHIFDRWGGVVFESYFSDEKWDGYSKGELMNRGVYVYLIKYRDLNSGELVTKAGEVLLIN